MTRIIFVLLFATLSVPSTCTAQAAQGTPPDPKQLSALEKLKPGELLRVQTQESGLLEGSFARSGDGWLWLQSEAGERSLRVSNVEGIWVRGRSTRKGATVGAISLGVVGGLGASLLASALNSLCETEGDCGVHGGEYVLVGLVGAAVGGMTGALLGAGIGSVVSSWHRLFP